MTAPLRLVFLFGSLLGALGVRVAVCAASHSEPAYESVVADSPILTRLPPIEYEWPAESEISGRTWDHELTEPSEAMPWSSKQDLGWREPYYRSAVLLACDQLLFYSEQGSDLLLGAGLAALVANTQLDRELMEHYQDSGSRPWLDRTSDFMEPWGEGRYVLGPLLAAGLIGHLVDGPGMESLGTWGMTGVRAGLVGAVPLVLMQKLTGGARPSERSSGSRWIPWKDDNGVSGHAFIGALPWLAAAQQVESPYWRLPLVGASTLTAFSRFHEGKHYFSQAALGWWIAYLASNAVGRTDLALHRMQLGPLFEPECVGFGISLTR